MIDAEDLLDDDNPGFGGARRIGAVGAELEIVRRRQGKMLTQGVPPRCMNSTLRAVAYSKGRAGGTVCPNA
jgi:hypothetical protein